MSEKREQKEPQKIPPERAKTLAFFWIFERGEYLEYKNKKNLRKIYVSSMPDEGEITLNALPVCGYIVYAKETVKSLKLQTDWEIFVSYQGIVTPLINRQRARKTMKKGF